MFPILRLPGEITCYGPKKKDLIPQLDDKLSYSNNLYGSSLYPSNFASDYLGKGVRGLGLYTKLINKD